MIKDLSDWRTVDYMEEPVNHIKALDSHNFMMFEDKTHPILGWVN